MRLWRKARQILVRICILRLVFPADPHFALATRHAYAPSGHFVRLFVDGDVICYRAGFATERPRYLVTADGFEPARFDDAKTAKGEAVNRITGEVWSRKEVEPVENAILAAESMLASMRFELGIPKAKVFVVMSGVGNFRHALATRAEYKGNRAGAERPKHYGAVREYLAGLPGTIVTAGEEADDRLGIEMTRDQNSVCCSIDKDLKQIPGWHYNFVTDALELISNRNADVNFYAQVLSGDAADNIPGLSGIGPIKAAKALEMCASPLDCWQVCLSGYKREFGKQAKRYALEAARLLYIRRVEGETWQPPKDDSGQLAWVNPVGVPSPRSPIEFSPITD